MPIRAELRKFYRGAAWRATRERILARAGNKCEYCGAPNGKTVLRQYGWWTAATLEATVWAQNARFRYEPGSRIEQNGALIETTAERQFIHLPWHHVGIGFQPFQQLSCTPNCVLHRWIRIILTVAHLNHVAGDDRDENLKALCQWCHLNYDKLHHKETRATRKDLARPLLQEEVAC